MNCLGLVEWHHLWRLEKSMVYCRQCGASQPEENGEDDFEHTKMCPSRYLGRRPWCELNKLVREVW